MVFIDFTKPWSHDDVILKIIEENKEQKDLHTSRAILEMWSPVFKAMLKDGHFKEGETKKVDLTGKNYDDVLELLKVMHPTNTDVTLSNAYNLLPLSHEYHMDDIVSKCETQIMSKRPNIKDVHIALKYGLTKLKNYCLEGVSKCWSLYRIQNDPNYDALCDELKFKILENKICKLEGLMSDGHISCKSVNSKTQNANNYGIMSGTLDSPPCPCGDKCMCKDLPIDSRRAEKVYASYKSYMKS